MILYHIQYGISKAFQARIQTFLNQFTPPKSLPSFKKTKDNPAENQVRLFFFAEPFRIFAILNQTNVA